jgi:hypothetical protein
MSGSTADPRCFTPAPGDPWVDAGLQPATASELEALHQKVAAVARAVGMRWALRFSFRHHVA